MKYLMTLNQDLLATMQACLDDSDVLEIVDTIKNAYSESSIPEYPDIDFRLQRQARPYSRRELIDGRLCNYFALKPHAQSKIVSTPNRSSYHTEIILHKRLNITISAVKHNRDIPREAQFRRNHAQANPKVEQLSLLEKPNNLIPFIRPQTKEENLLYVILIHGESRRNYPAFINFIVPDSECKNILVTYDLMREYSRIKSAPAIANTDGFIENIESPASKLRIKKPIESDENKRDVN